MKKAYITEVKKFFLRNRTYWEIYSPNINKVLIDGYCHSPQKLIKAGLVGNRISKLCELEPIVLLKESKKSFNAQEIIFNSFGIFEVVKLSNYINRFVIICKSMYSVLRMLTYSFSLSSFLSFSVEGIVVGDLIYSFLSLNDVKRKKHPVYYLTKPSVVFNYFRVFWIQKKLFSEFNVKCVVINNTISINSGLLYRFAAKYDAVLYVLGSSDIQKYNRKIDVSGIDSNPLNKQLSNKNSIEQNLNEITQMNDHLDKKGYECLSKMESFITDSTKKLQSFSCDGLFNCK